MVFISQKQIAEETKRLNEKITRFERSNKVGRLEATHRDDVDGTRRVAFFPSVVVNIVTDSFEVKALVYMFLVRTAEQKPDEALLSINSFQKRIWRTKTRG